MPLNLERERLLRAIRSRVPATPGIYEFYDRDGALLYVGKSVNLVSRMANYFQTDAGWDSSIKRMIFSIHDFGFRETGSELIALLLEDAVIKEKRPRFNTRQQEYSEYRYLELTADAFPTCRMVEHGEDVSGVLFGPFRDQYFVAKLLAVVNRHFRLRTCVDPMPFRKSMNFELGFCQGPCRGEISVDEYSDISLRVEAFLDGDVDWISQTLKYEMQACSAAREYEKAAVLKARRDFCLRFCERQQFIKKFKVGVLRVQVTGGEPEMEYEFDAGRLTGLAGHTARPQAGSIGVPAELRQCPTDPRFLLDRANVMFNWLHRNGETCGFSFH